MGFAVDALCITPPSLTPARGGGGLRRSKDANYPPPPRGLRPTVSCQRCRPQASMGGKGTRCSMNTKGALRKILSTLHPNTILKPNLDSTAHPQPSACNILGFAFLVFFVSACYPRTVFGFFFFWSGLWGRTVRCARAVRKVGHSPPPVGSFLGVGLLQGTIAIVYPCSINPPPSCSHFSDPLLHSPWTLMLEIGCSTLAPMGCEFLP